MFSQEVLGYTRQPVAFARQEAVVLALEFLEQADGTILRVALEVDHAETIGTDREMHADIAFGQDMAAGCLELLARDVVEPGVRRLEAGVDVA